MTESPGSGAEAAPAATLTMVTYVNRLLNAFLTGMLDQGPGPKAINSCCNAHGKSAHTQAPPMNAKASG
jgi:hypothetical protein